MKNIILIVLVASFTSFAFAGDDKCKTVTNDTQHIGYEETQCKTNANKDGLICNYPTTCPGPVTVRGRPSLVKINTDGTVASVTNAAGDLTFTCQNGKWYHIKMFDKYLNLLCQK